MLSSIYFKINIELNRYRLIRIIIDIQTHTVDYQNYI